jgi:fumarate reductase subunit D
MKKILLFIVVIFLLTPTFVLADPAVNAPPGTIDDLTADDVVRFLKNLANWLGGVVFIIAILVMLVGAFVYMTSGGDEKKLATAKSIITYDIVAIVIVAISYGIVSIITTLIKGFAGK